MVAGLGDPKQLAPPGAGLQAQAVAVGGTHACAIVNEGPGNSANGSIRCWGDNEYGELGADPDAIGYTSVPVRVADPLGNDLPAAASLMLAQDYSCTITTDQYFLCWGNVPEGSGVTREQSGQSVYQPALMDVEMRPLAGVNSAAVGPNGGCCTLADSSLVCWGGELVPPDITPDGGVVSLDDGGVIVSRDKFDTVAVGSDHACGIAATDSSGSQDVECWGADNRGQAGLAFTPIVNRAHHLGLGAMGHLRQVVAGGNDSCALFDNASVYCWGSDDSGLLGSAGQDTYVPQPVAFASTTGVPIELAMGDAHACALLSDRSVWCWGDNSASQLGGGAGAAPFQVTPSPVLSGGAPLADVLYIAAGGSTTCAILLDDPHVWCWGKNDHGQAGQPPSAIPVAQATRVSW
jgi:alpha-tubulin suppressor-like RCC1 family protein